MPHLLFIISKYYVGHFHYVPQQALKSWKEPVHLEKKDGKYAAISCAL